ncbi:hypothetical protein [Flavobacterium branchiicola]|uniref:YD repeat-containing protein n=1 Tax=Flavobacterium branchiicola TaxID=1114875 RepID=A0ABV9PDS1_9FLAO|nr:hypothetical protein [Flavobacterium branchiicola]MBS7254677.1 hypothetical protein [Flavobacterium branchiicola]
MELQIAGNFLKEMEVDLIDYPSSQMIKYKKYYRYDDDGRLIFTKTLNLSSGKIEDQQKIEYKRW